MNAYTSYAGKPKYEDEIGKFYYDTRRNKDNQKQRVKVYLTKIGTPVGSVWYYPHVQGKARTGWGTEKPEPLLRRIIETSSNPNDVVLDPYCGCGTSISVAQQLGRKWVGIDISPTACRKMRDRLNKLGAVPQVIGMPTTIEDLKSLSPFDFQEWVINQIGGTPSTRKVNDKGIDGYNFVRKPVQIKQSEDVGRNVVDNFETAIRRAGYTEGTIYAFSFTKGKGESGAYAEVARASEEDGLNITLTEVDDSFCSLNSKETH